MNKQTWEWVDIKLLKTDGHNPNVLSKKSKEALKSNIMKFGWNMPIITNQDYLIADGEQKLTVAREMGLTEVPVLRKQLTESDRLIIRQSMNKLHGEHQEDLDAEEFKRILANVGLEELTALTAVSEQEVLNLINKLDKEPELPKNEVDTLYKQLCTCPKCGFQFQKGEE